MSTREGSTPSGQRAAVSLLSRLRTPAGQANPYPIYDDLRALGPVIAAPWGGHLVTSYHLCHQVLRSHHWGAPDSAWRVQQGDGTRWTTASGLVMARTLASLNPPKHAQIRSLGRLPFGRLSLEQMRSAIEDITTRLLDHLDDDLRGGKIADLHTTVSEELPIATVGHWMGLPAADYPSVRALTHETVYAQELLPQTSQLARADSAVAQLLDYFGALVRARRRHPGPDPISTWITAWTAHDPDQRAADEEITLLAYFVAIAALETTATLLSTMVLTLLRQGLWVSLSTHPERVANAVEESLRWDPPIHVVTRVALAGAVLNGAHVPPGHLAHLLIGAANRDPAKFSSPDTFDLHRRGQAHLSFGGGLHYCLGAPLARLEAQTLLTGLLSRFPRLALAGRPQWAARVAFRRLTALPVVLT